MSTREYGFIMLWQMEDFGRTEMSKNIILTCDVYYGHTDFSKLLMHSCTATVIVGGN